MATFNYGHALYYPHIFPRSRRWLRTAALYHDQIGRIVPHSYLAGDYSRLANHELRSDFDELVDAGFITDEHPDQVLQEVSKVFCDFSSALLENEERRSQLVPELAATHKLYNMYTDKMDRALLNLLERKGLARSVGQNEIEIDPILGGLYMLFLAQAMAKARPIVSDNPIYEALMFRPASQDPPPRALSDVGFVLATAVFKTIVPLDVESLPMRDLINFRNDHSDERTAFYDEISKLASDLHKAKDHKELEDAVSHYAAGIRANTARLERKLGLLKLQLGSGLFSVSLPGYLTSSAFGLGLTNPAILAAAGGLVITGMIANAVLEHKITADDQKISYIHSLRSELGPEAYADEIIQLNLTGSSPRRKPTLFKRVRRLFSK